MKKTLLALTILAAFVLTGCGNESKTVNESKTPQAKPAVKVEEQQKQETKSNEREYKFKRNVKLGEGLTNEPLHQFKTNNN